MILKHSYIAVKSKKIAGCSWKAATKLAFGTALAHVKYIQHRDGDDRGKEGREFFDAFEDHVTGKDVREAVRALGTKGVVIHKLILAPDVNPADPKAFAREVMHELELEKGLDLTWMGTVHKNTDNHHVHVVVLGKDKNGREVRFSKQDHKLMKERGDRYLDRNHPLERQEKQRERKERWEKIREKERIARDAYKSRHYIGRDKTNRLKDMYEGRTEAAKKELDERVNQKNTGNAVGGRWQSPIQSEVTGNPVFSIFMMVAGISREIVNSIPLKEQKDELKEIFEELESSRRDMEERVRQEPETEFTKDLNKSIEKHKDSLSEINRDMDERERDSKKPNDDRDRDLGLFG